MPRRLAPRSFSAAAGLRAALVCLAALSSALLACGDPPASEYPTQRVYVEDTTLGPGDIFEVRVYQQEELSNTYAVNADGSISFPLIGSVQVDGKTPAQVEQSIRERLADGYLVDPQVSILVKEYKSRKLSVFGQVRDAGTLSFSEGMTITDAISQAGGFTPMAKKNAVRVTRTKNGEKTKYTVPVERIGNGKAANFFMRPGDVVFVPERLF